MVSLLAPWSGSGGMCGSSFWSAPSGSGLYRSCTGLRSFFAALSEFYLMSRNERLKLLS